MGLFDKKLDYSYGNGALPWFNEDAYSTLTLPSSGTVFLPNINLIEKEKKAGKLGYFIELVSESYQANEGNSKNKKLVEKYLTGLKQVFTPNANSEAIQLIGWYMDLGISVADVEEQSTLQIEGKTHPSVTNAMFSLLMDARRDSEVQQILRGINDLTTVLGAAIRVGYLAKRDKGALTVQEMFRK